MSAAKAQENQSRDYTPNVLKASGKPNESNRTGSTPRMPQVNLAHWEDEKREAPGF